MNFFSYTIRHFLDAFRDTFKTIKYFDLVKINNFLIYFKLLFIKLIFSIQSIRSLIKVKKNNLKENRILLDQEIEFKDTIDQIDTKGYSNIYILNEDTTKKIKNEIYKS